MTDSSEKTIEVDVDKTGRKRMVLFLYDRPLSLKEKMKFYHRYFRAIFFGKNYRFSPLAGIMSHWSWPVQCSEDGSKLEYFKRYVRGYKDYWKEDFGDFWILWAKCKKCSKEQQAGQWPEKLWLYSEHMP